VGGGAESGQRAVGGVICKGGLGYVRGAAVVSRHEPHRLAIVLSGRRRADAWDAPLDQQPAPLDFFDLKGVVDRLAAAMHLPEVSVRGTKDVPFLHPGRAAELLVGDKTVGSVRELDHKAAIAFGVPVRADVFTDAAVDAL